jgi:hypothetical protein
MKVHAQGAFVEGAPGCRQLCSKEVCVCVCVCVCVQNALVEQGSVDEELAFRSILYYNVLLEYFCTIKASKLNRVRLACIEAASGCCQL